MANDTKDDLALVRDLKARNEALEVDLRRLKSGGGGGTLDNMVSLREYVDKADEAVESRLNSKLDKLATKGTVWAAVATVLGILLTVAAFAGGRFDAGLNVGPRFDAVIAEQHKRDDAQDRKFDEILKRLPPKR